MIQFFKKMYRDLFHRKLIFQDFNGQILKIALAKIYFLKIDDCNSSLIIVNNRGQVYCVPYQKNKDLLGEELSQIEANLLRVQYFPVTTKIKSKTL